jgi:hypothetical protein
MLTLSRRSSPAAKGRVERAHLTLQDRLVKELRLAAVSTIEAANGLMPSFIAAYNARFAKLPRNSHDAHRAVRDDEDLDFIFAWRELRKVTQTLTLRYERKLYLLHDTSENRRLINKYVEVFQFPDGRIEIRVAGRAVPYSRYDKLAEVIPTEIVESKRLGQVLRVAQEVQKHRDSRVVKMPSTAHRADGTRIPRTKIVGSKRPRDLSPEDLHQALNVVVPELLPPSGRQTALLPRPLKGARRTQRADIST